MTSSRWLGQSISRRSLSSLVGVRSVSGEFTWLLRTILLIWQVCLEWMTSTSCSVSASEMLALSSLMTSQSLLNGLRSVFGDFTELLQIKNTISWSYQAASMQSCSYSAPSARQKVDSTHSIQHLHSIAHSNLAAVQRWSHYWRGSHIFSAWLDG